jgi:arylsulfatase A-like enzyme
MKKMFLNFVVCRCSNFRTALSVGILLGCHSLAQGKELIASNKHYNVLMIIIDDVAANLHSVKNESLLRTPNIERIASRGTWFTHAYNDAPVCCASRTAMLTGVHSAGSGVYYNTQPYRRAGTWISNVETLPAAFLNHGYLTASFGKFVHNSYQEDNIADFTPGFYKMFDRTNDVIHTDTSLLKFILPGTKREISGNSSGNWTWGILPDDWDRNDPTKLQQDTEEANRTIEFLRTKHDKLFFLGCGFWRPHVRWTVPQRYYDMFPLDKIEIPDGYKPDDLEDLPKPGRWIAAHRGEHADVVASGMWKKSLQGYYASMAYIDEQIGRVLDALEQSPERENTIVVFLSDNGMHLGEKDHWLKYALWEQTCRVFFSISVPGYPKQFSETPVGLIDLYPTLASLCGIPLPTTHKLDGVDLKKLLAGKTKERGAPVLSTYGRGNHAVRDSRYRYIRYRNGDEELYDDKKDPCEWANLAGDSRFDKVKIRLRKWLPKEDAPDVPEVSAARDGSRWSDEAFTK